MSSKQSNLATIRGHLRRTLEPTLNKYECEIVDHITSPSASLVTRVYFVFTEIANEIAGTQLAAGMIAANFEVIIVTPQQNSDIAENRADNAVLGLVHALENSEDLFWGPSAVKLRLDTGEFAWSVPVSVLTSSLPDNSYPHSYNREEP